MIQIYNPDNTEFDYNGDMILLPEEATVHVILGSTWEAEIVHPIDDEGRWAYIVENAVVKMPSFNGEQLWRIVSTEKTDSGVSAAMQPIFYDAANEVFLVDVRPTDKSGQEALDILMEDTKYSGESDIETPYTAYYEYKNLLEALNGDINQSFVNRWGGEIIYDNFKVIINTEAGEDNGVEIRYGKNIPENGFTVTEDMSEIVTRIYPKGYDGVTMTDNGYVDSGHINDYPTVRAATITYDYIYYTADMDEDDIAELEEDETNVLCATQAELDEALTEACEAEFDAGIDVPAVTIECDMVLLQNTEQYKDVEVLEEVSLGDTIYIVNSHIGFETTARVIELEYDSILRRITSVVIGDYEYDYFSESTKTASELLSSVNNLTASVGEFKTVITEELYAVYANIETLTAGYAEITELKATVATIEEAYIDEAYVATLLANYASITYLEANYINADTIEATYATIETLESTTASIQALFSDYASISYLEANYVTTDTLAADLAYIDETYIKSAAITELLTDYVTATQLYALTGTVEDLTATYLTVTGDETVEGDLTINGLLSAVYASIGTVAADYISANTAVITTIIADYISADSAELDSVFADYLSSNSADIESIVSSYIVTEYLTATGIESDTITVGDIFGLYATIDYVESTFVTTSTLTAEIAAIQEAYITSATVTELLADYATVTQLNAVSATINSLSSSYAEIDFSNVTVENVVDEFVSNLLIAQGFITESATAGTLAVTGYLTGVQIVADVITAGTLSVERLIITGEDSIVYEINVSSSGLTATELTDEIYQEYLNGTVIVAQSITATQIAAGTITSNEIASNTITASNIASGTITATELASGSVTAEKISVSDLYALGATIGGFTIGSTAIYSSYDSFASYSSNIYIGSSGISLGTTFSVTYAGELTATSGTIGAITINTLGLYAYNSSYSSSYAGIYRPVTIYTSTIAFFAGATARTGSSAVFKVTYGGTLTATSATITGTIYASGGTIGGFTIGDTSIYSSYDSYASYSGNIYIGSSGISLGTYFAVSPTGILTASGATITGTITATSGTIGGFTIGGSSIYTSYNSFATYSSNIYIGSSGISLGTVFSVTPAGYLTATSGLIGAFYLGSTALYTSSSSFGTVSNNIYIGTSGISLSTTFKVTAAGAITATSGTIGAITLSSTGLYAYNSSYSSSYAGIYRPSTITTSSYAFFAGATSAAGASAGFYVTYGGTMYASNAEISGTITTESGYYKSVLTSGNLYFYYNSTLMGTYGSTAWADDSTVRGVRFGMEYYCDFMSFSRKTSASADTYTMYMYFDWSGDISGYANALILSVNAHFQSAPHFETAVYHYNAHAIYFYTSGDSTTGGYLYMSSSDNISLACSSGSLYVYSSGGNVSVYSTAGNASLYSSSDYTRIGYSGLATYIYGYISNNVAFANGAGHQFYDTSGEYAGGVYISTGNNIFLYSGSYPVYVYGSTTYLGYGGTNTYIRGTTAFTGTVSMTYSCDIATNGYGIRLTDMDGELFYVLFCGSAYGYVYVGNTSYVTYVRGSTIYMNGSAYSSDISVKNSITTMDDSYLDLIDRLTPRSFYYNWNSEDYCSGFIAQEVMEALEEVGITNDTLVRYNKEEGTYALDYNGFIPILVAAVKELRSEVAALQTELSALQSA